MTLTFKFNCACRLCDREFDPAAPAEAITPGGHRLSQHRIRLPRVARRHLLPNVCDDCWDGFSKWMAAKEMGQHRAQAKYIKRERHDSRDQIAEHTSERYQNFSQEVLCEWLNEGLEVAARIELRDRVVDIATETDFKRKERARKYWSRGVNASCEKTGRRNWSRYAPHCVPSWVEWQQGCL
jgi:hypothetical protein